MEGRRYRGLKYPKDVVCLIMKWAKIEMDYLLKKHYRCALQWNGRREMVKIVRTDISRWQVLRTQDPRFSHFVVLK